MSRKLWAVINYIHKDGEWVGKIRMTSSSRAEADTRCAELFALEGWGPSELVVRKITMTVPDIPVLAKIRAAKTVGEVRDVVMTARLAYLMASLGTKKKWERAATQKELALSRFEARKQIVSIDIDNSQVIKGGSGLLGPDGRPVLQT